MSEFKLGDYFLRLSPKYEGDVERIVKVESDEYYISTVKGSHLARLNNAYYSQQDIQKRINKGIWKKISNLQANILMGEIK